MSARWRVSPGITEAPRARAFGFALLAVFFAARAAAEPASPYSVFLNGGILAHDLGRPASSSSGSSSFFGTGYPHFSVYGRVPVDADVTLGLDLGYTIPGRSLSDGAGTASIFTAGVPMTLAFGPIEAKGAVGILFYRVAGDGGTTTQRSGNSEATYPLPARSETSRLVYLSAGAGLFLMERVRADLDLLMSGLGSGKAAATALFRVGVGIL